MMSILHVEVRKEDNFQPSSNIGIVIDHLGNGIDQLDNQLCHEVSRRGLAAEDERAGHYVLIGSFLDAIVQSNNVQNVEVLPLVFVDPLDLNVEQRVGICRYPCPFLHKSSKFVLIVA